MAGSRIRIKNLRVFFAVVVFSVLVLSVMAAITIRERRSRAAGCSCICHLRMLQGAKEQWSLEKRASVGEFAPEHEVATYIKGNTVLRCPQGGTYELGRVGENVKCSVPAHSLLP